MFLSFICLPINFLSCVFCCSGARDVGGVELGAASSCHQHGPPAPRPPVPGASTRHRFPPLPSKIFRSVTLCLTISFVRQVLCLIPGHRCVILHILRGVRAIDGGVSPPKIYGLFRKSCTLMWHSGVNARIVLRNGFAFFIDNRVFLICSGCNQGVIGISGTRPVWDNLSRYVCPITIRLESCITNYKF